MAAKNRTARASDIAQAARNSPYVQRLIEDQALRDNMIAAFESVRSAYGRMSNGKPATKALMNDKKLQRELRSAADALREVGTALKAPPKRRRRLRLGRMIMLAIVGAGLALILSEDLRSKALDALFGSEEEFDYTSTTAPSTPAPDPVSA